MPDRPHRVCSRMHTDKPQNGICPRCREIAEEDEPQDVEPVAIEQVIECKGDYYPTGEWA